MTADAVKNLQMDKANLTKLLLVQALAGQTQGKPKTKATAHTPAHASTSTSANAGGSKTKHFEVIEGQSRI